MQPLSQKRNAAVDARIRSLMRDPRYWKDRDPGLLDHVTRQWARAYPGTSVHTGFKRPDPQPAIRPEAVEPWPPILEAPQRLLGLARPGMLPPHPTPAVHKPGWTWNGWTGEWERMTPEEAAAEPARLERGPIPLKADAPTLGHNSALSREDALAALREQAGDGSMSPSAFLKEAERIRQAHPDDGADGARVQVADASQAGESVTDAADAPLTASDVMPPLGTRKERRDRQGRLEPKRFIPANSQAYEIMDGILNSEEGAIRSRWFKAASDVTGLTGVGSVDVVNLGVLSDQDDAFLRYRHHALAPENFALFDRLRAGDPPEELKGLSGKDLDYALVEREQALVQHHIDAYFENRPAEERRAVMESLSRAADPTSDLGKLRQRVSGGVLAQAMNKAFPNGGYDFADRRHREALGKAMIDMLYEGRAE